MNKFALLFLACCLSLSSYANAAGHKGSHAGYKRHAATPKYDRIGKHSKGCGSRGGPGYRKPNGKCASWRD